ncbi:hypothetical protein PR202_gb02908 [Eleusine coracana subsp. coracana]|uniref:Alpha/beta hydrolase fold-3 domain-containing protein n=1 Tax=Eleusine coracana subsp. coracana TaxID=191504 RepID=A0AAV5DY24_ELECO|nr:hypothetical protein PR202_gb02908 [Eleusine coracana subsp. coracana]
MDPDAEIAFEFVPVIRQYKSGRVERLIPCNPVPPSVDAATGVTSRDVTIDAATGVWARLYLPDLSKCPPGGRLPVVIYFHGGGLVVGSAAEASEHAFLNRLAARAGALVVSVEYRLAPEHPVPACYDDAWAAVRAGGNVAHNVTLRAGLEEEQGDDGGARVKGMALLHPYFLAATKAEGEVKVPWVREKLEELWAFACGGCGGRDAAGRGPDDPRVNPVAEGAPSLRRLGCDRVLVCTAEDELEVRGKAYYEGLLASGWEKGDVELLDSAGEEHEFHLHRPDSPKALGLMDRLVAFIQEKQENSQ